MENENLTPWDEFKGGNRIPDRYELTAIACPCCGSALRKDNSVALTSYPVQYRYICFKCNWSGTA